jgi:hypothetical protein
MWQIILSVPTDTPLPSFLAQLPSVTFCTHFAAFCNHSEGDDFPAVTRHILVAYTALRVSVLHPVRRETKLESLPSTDDIRFVYVTLGARFINFWDGWFTQPRGGIDCWARADVFVEKKRRGEIQPGSFIRLVERHWISHIPLAASRCWIEPADDIAEMILNNRI